MMEQIAAIIDYDMTDYLPPNARGFNKENSEYLAPQSNSIKRQKAQSAMVNNFMPTHNQAMMSYNHTSRFATAQRSEIAKTPGSSKRQYKSREVHHNRVNSSVQNMDNETNDEDAFTES